MKRIALTICSATILLMSCNSSSNEKVTTETATADTSEIMADATTETTNPAPPMDSAAVMKAWQVFRTPGAMHKWLAKTNGTWEAEVS